MYVDIFVISITFLNLDLFVSNIIEYDKHLFS